MSVWTKVGISLQVAAVVLCASLHAQDLHTLDTKIIKVFVLDGRTGHSLSPTGFQVRVDHIKTSHGDWVKPNDDGYGELTLPAQASSVSMRFSYDSNMEIYVNCDEDKDKEKENNRPKDLWYSVLDILTKGVIVPNTCVKPKNAGKIKVPELKPGEIVFYVRPKNWIELGMEH
jgi:hypothetical protein